MRTKAFLVAILLLAGCVSAPRVAPDPAARPFPAIVFFTGETQGTGVLRVAMHRPCAIHVSGQGHVEPDGTLVLDQHVAPDGGVAKDRQWRIRETAPGRISGTLSDASAAVSGIATPGLLVLRFRMKGGLDAVQRLTLAADGRSARNIMTISKMGMRVAVLDETIRRLG